MIRCVGHPVFRTPNFEGGLDGLFRSLILGKLQFRIASMN
jgi:hypothetical protein